MDLRVHVVIEVRQLVVLAVSGERRAAGDALGVDALRCSLGEQNIIDFLDGKEDAIVWRAEATKFKLGDRLFVEGRTVAEVDFMTEVRKWGEKLFFGLLLRVEVGQAVRCRRLRRQLFDQFLLGTRGLVFFERVDEVIFQLLLD